MVPARLTVAAAWVACAICIGIASAGSEQPAADREAATASPRTDGVYYFTMPGSRPAPVLRVVRFYDDGVALEGDVSGDPAAKANWLDRDDRALLPGRWVLEGDELVFKLSTGFKETVRRGKIAEQGWVINDTVVFKFVSAPFPAPAATTKNRRPYFVGPGKGTRVFQYDEAGRQTGVSHELEIEAVDPDGDPLTFAWKATNGLIVGSGPKVELRPTGPGAVTVTVTDGKGGSIESSTELD